MQTLQLLNPKRQKNPWHKHNYRERLQGKAQYNLDGRWMVTYKRADGDGVTGRVVAVTGCTTTP